MEDVNTLKKRVFMKEGWISRLMLEELIRLEEILEIFFDEIELEMHPIPFKHLATNNRFYRENRKKIDKYARKDDICKMKGYVVKLSKPKFKVGEIVKFYDGDDKFMIMNVVPDEVVRFIYLLQNIKDNFHKITAYERNVRRCDE